MDIRPAHRTCNRQAGGELLQTLARVGAAVARGDVTSDFLLTTHDHSGSAAPSPTQNGTETYASDPDDAEPAVITPGPSDPFWNSCPWLDPLREVPPDATWPRLMSPPHPDAVGTFGHEAAELGAGMGVTLRWWQHLALVRLLEHDADGQLVWVDALISTARQVGKSVLLCVLAWWRLHQADRFGEAQLIMHTGKDIQVCAEVQRRARIAAREQGYPTREANGQQEIWTPDGADRWMVRAQQSVYGYASTLALADEAWKLLPSVVEEGLEPTLAETNQGQLVLFSTAHRSCTGLVPVRRAAMLDRWGIPGGTSLLLEWSAPRGAELDDRDAWRQASPHWGPARQRLMDAKYARASGGQSVDPDEADPVESFRSQFLNVWPVRRIVATTRAELLVDPETWAQSADLYVGMPDGPVSVAVEDFYGLGAAAAAAVNLADGRVLVWGDVFTSRAEAYAWAGFTVGRRTGSRIRIGASLPEAEAAEVLGPELEKCGTAHTYAGLPLLRSLIRSGRLCHSGDEAMAAQVGSVRLVPTSSGGLTPAHKGVRSDLIRATAWAVQAAAEPAAEPLEFFVY